MHSSFLEENSISAYNYLHIGSDNYIVKILNRSIESVLYVLLELQA